MSVSNLIKPTTQAPPSWSNLNVKSLTADTIISGGGGGIGGIESGNVLNIIQDENPKTTAIVFDEPFTTIPRVVCNIFDPSYRTENMSIYVESKTVNGCDVSVFLDNTPLGDEPFNDDITLFANTPVSQIILANDQPAIAWTSGANPNAVTTFSKNGLDSGGGIWEYNTIPNSENNGHISSIVLADGTPAIFRAVIGSGPNGLDFLRNPDKEGDGVWSVFQLTALTAGLGEYTNDCALLGELPACIDVNNTFQLRVNPAVDGSGIWASHQILASPVDYPNLMYTTTDKAAITYLEGTNFKFAINAAADGSGAWATSIINGSAIYGSCAGGILYGKPCITYLENGSLVFVVSSTADGSAGWATHPVYNMTTPTAETFDSRLNQQSFCEYNGGIAIAWKATNSDELRLSTCPNPDGTGTWTTEVLRSGLDLIGDSDISMKLLASKGLGIAYQAKEAGVNVAKYLITEVKLEYNIDYIAME